MNINEAIRMSMHKICFGAKIIVKIIIEIFGVMTAHNQKTK